MNTVTSAERRKNPLQGCKVSLGEMNIILATNFPLLNLPTLRLLCTQPEQAKGIIIAGFCFFVLRRRSSFCQRTLVIIQRSWARAVRLGMNGGGACSSLIMTSFYSPHHHHHHPPPPLFFSFLFSFFLILFYFSSSFSRLDITVMVG